MLNLPDFASDLFGGGLLNFFGNLCVKGAIVRESLWKWVVVEKYGRKFVSEIGERFPQDEL